MNFKNIWNKRFRCDVSQINLFISIMCGSYDLCVWWQRPLWNNRAPSGSRVGTAFVNRFSVRSANLAKSVTEYLLFNIFTLYSGYSILKAFPWPLSIKTPPTPRLPPDYARLRPITSVRSITWSSNTGLRCGKAFVSTQ